MYFTISGNFSPWMSVMKNWYLQIASPRTPCIWHPVGFCQWESLRGKHSKRNEVLHFLKFLDSSYLIVILEVAVLLYCHIFYLRASLLKEHLFLDSIIFVINMVAMATKSSNLLVPRDLYSHSVSNQDQ